MKEQAANAQITAKLMLHLLPVQVLLAAVGAVNGIVSSFFASNYVGVTAMSAVGVYAPLQMFLNAVSLMLVGGSVILYGRYMGQNDQEKLQNLFRLSLVITLLAASVFTVLFLVLGSFDLTGFLTRNPEVRLLFNRYLLGQSIGVFPLLMGNQLAAFLSIENRARRTLMASVAYILVNLILNSWFVRQLHMEAFGLALASAIGLWVYLLVQVPYFFSGKSAVRMSRRHLSWKDTSEIIRVGISGALTTGYQTIRGLILNWLLEIFVGAVGISALATANSFLGIFWAIPNGMLAVSRMLISVSVGEEDRQTLTDIMRVMFRRFIPLMCAVCAVLMLLAVPVTRMFYHDPSQPVFMMTVWGLRLLPLCMPTAIICMHFVCYGQASRKQALVQVVSALDGVICVAALSALLIRIQGMNSVYTANILNGVICALAFFVYAWIKNRHVPKNMEELMVISDDFGVPETERMDLTVRTMEEVVCISRRIREFCLEKGIDQRRAYMSGLAMEEMAGNIVEHGFTKDKKAHTVDVRVVHKDDEVILRLKDDCVPFDPGERRKMASEDDPAKNIGIRMVFKLARDVKYQNILGLNVLTIRL